MERFSLDLESVECIPDQVVALATAEDVRFDCESTASPRAIVRRLDSVEPQAVEWLWPGRIAVGKLTLLAGDPGLGKSFVTLDMAARVSRGASWPDDSSTKQSVGGVVLLSAEDDLADTIRPRLDAHNADVSRIVALEAVGYADKFGEMRRGVDLTKDLEHIETAVDAAGDCRLIVIDPVSAFLGGTDSHKNADVRAVLSRLADLAERKRIAVVAVTHLRKGEGMAIYRAMGSLAFVAAARAAWAVVKDQDDQQKRLMLPLKNNLAPDVDGLAYCIQESDWGGTPFVSWFSDPVTVSVDEAIASPKRKNGPEPVATEDAEEWLAESLADGPRKASEMYDEASNAKCFSKRTVERARSVLGVEAHRPDNPGPWFWRLPVEAHRHPEPRDKTPGGLGGVPKTSGFCDDLGGHTATPPSSEKREPNFGRPYELPF